MKTLFGISKLNLRILKGEELGTETQKSNSLFISVAQSCLLNSNKFVVIKSFRRMSLIPIAMDKRRLC